MHGGAAGPQCLGSELARGKAPVVKPSLDLLGIAEEKEAVLVFDDGDLLGSSAVVGHGDLDSDAFFSSESMVEILGTPIGPSLRSWANRRVLDHERKGDLKEPLFLTADFLGASQRERMRAPPCGSAPQLQFAMPYAKNILLTRI